MLKPGKLAIAVLVLPFAVVGTVFELLSNVCISVCLFLLPDFENEDNHGQA